VSSHGRYGCLLKSELLEGRIGCSAIGGGGCAEVKKVVDRKWGHLSHLGCIVLCVGGNDAARRCGGVQVRETERERG
jgi:hypothetical protein